MAETHCRETTWHITWDPWSILQQKRPSRTFSPRNPEDTGRRGLASHPPPGQHLPLTPSLSDRKGPCWATATGPRFHIIRGLGSPNTTQQPVGCESLPFGTTLLRSRWTTSRASKGRAGGWQLTLTAGWCVHRKLQERKEAVRGWGTGSPGGLGHRRGQSRAAPTPSHMAETWPRQHLCSGCRGLAHVAVHSRWL